jgi:hypothetical protein
LGLRSGRAKKYGSKQRQTAHQLFSLAVSVSICTDSGNSKEDKAAAWSGSDKKDRPV